MNTLQIYKESNTTTTIHKDQDIHNEILKKTKNIFEEVNELPIADPTLINYIGEYAQKKGAKEILQSKIRNENIPNVPMLKEFINNLCYPNTIKTNLIDTEMTTTEFIEEFRKTNENTTASPSGVHYFHYKAATYDEYLSSLLALRISIPFLFPIKVQRWAKDHHIIIPKTQLARIDKLRNIQIIEADYNTYYKYKINHQLMSHPKPLQILQKQMYGGIKKRSSHLAILNQLLINDYIILTKSAAYLTQFDAANCYDRMAPNMVVVALTRIGVPREIGIQLAINSLSTSHRIITNNCLSKNRIKRGKDLLWTGVGQGNSVAGTAWLALETAKINTYKNKKTFFLAYNPSYTIKYKNSLITYADDNNTAKVFPNNTSISEIIRTNNNNSKKWSHILQASGGKLSTNKCSTQIIQWEWKKNNVSVIPFNNDKILHYEKHSMIPLKNPHSSSKYLGCWLNTTQENSDQYKKVHEYTVNFGDQIRIASLPRHLTYLAYTTIYIAKIRHILPSANFTTNQIKNINAN